MDSAKPWQEPFNGAPRPLVHLRAGKRRLKRLRTPVTTKRSALALRLAPRDCGPFYSPLQYDYLPMAITVKSFAITGKGFCYILATRKPRETGGLYAHPLKHKAGSVPAGRGLALFAGPAGEEATGAYRYGNPVQPGLWTQGTPCSNCWIPVCCCCCSRARD